MTGTPLSLARLTSPSISLILGSLNTGFWHLFFPHVYSFFVLLVGLGRFSERGGTHRKFQSPLVLTTEEA